MKITKYIEAISVGIVVVALLTGFIGLIYFGAHSLYCQDSSLINVKTIYNLYPIKRLDSMNNGQPKHFYTAIRVQNCTGEVLNTHVIIYK